MRGQKLFKDVLKTGADERRGRNDSLLRRRNNCMIARYFYYGYFKEKSFEDIMVLLAGEFFISQITIVRIVQQNTEKIKELKDKEVTIYQLQQNWPQYKW